jgi:PHD/YefM family antitoxin component YafN of YafNO toxin-antitoxin module
MKTITAAQFEQDFEAIIDDVAQNKTTYKILLSTDSDQEQAVMVIPYEEYEYLQDVYTDSLNLEEQSKPNQDTIL